MGTWAKGAFDNDGAADFIDELASSPARGITRALETIAKAKRSTYLDVDDGSAAWAACELVALSFGYGDLASVPDHVSEILDRLKPQEEQRVLALSILARLAHRQTSELAGLWAENAAGTEPAESLLDRALADLTTRLKAAKKGARAVAKPKAGDVLVFPEETDGKSVFAIQMVNTREVAVFEGIFASDAAVLEGLKTAKARRVLASVNRLVLRARGLGNVPIRKDLRGEKLYAGDTGTLGFYVLGPASAPVRASVPYEEARTYDLDERYGLKALRDAALGKKPVGRVRSPEEHEAEIREQYAEEWTKGRKTTTAAPFGDLALLDPLLQWIEEFGIENAIRRKHDESVGMQGYGRPSERSERSSYDFVGLVALWKGGLAATEWPSSLRDRLPPPPEKSLLRIATTAARVLVGKVITRDSALRMIWSEASPKKSLAQWVEELQSALED